MRGMSLTRSYMRCGAALTTVCVLSWVSHHLLLVLAMSLLLDSNCTLG